MWTTVPTEIRVLFLMNISEECHGTANIFKTFFFSKTLSTIQQKPDVEKYKMPSTYISKIVQPMHFLDFIIMISTESKESKLLL